jgi:hypothetical protein
MHKIAETRRRSGYRRVGIMLERKGMIMKQVRPPRPRPGTAMSSMVNRYVMR